MSPNQFFIEIKPWQKGRLSKIEIKGVLSEVPPPGDWRVLSAILAGWSGSPVALALPVERVRASWVNQWVTRIHSVDARHLIVHYRVRRDRGSLPIAASMVRGSASVCDSHDDPGFPL